MTDERQALITTFTGAVIDPFNPDPAQISIRDIEQSLSLQTRFCGHTMSFLSVAQHCVMVSELCRTEVGKKWGLLHDASEAYISDVPRPLKRQLPLFVEVEERLFKALAEKFGLPYPMPDEVKFFDYIALYLESKAFMPNGAVVPKPEDYTPPLAVIKSWSPQEARTRFRERYVELFP